MIRRTEKRRALCLALLIANLAFIWGNSMLPAHISAAISGFVRDVLSKLLGGAGDGGADGVMGEGVLRKIAHFIEFTCLGCLLGWLFSMLRKHWLVSLLCGVLVASVDELIQCFVPGRGPGILDVLLDSVGVACGIAVLLAGYTIYQKRRNNQK